MKDRGFIAQIILIIIALALLKYFLDWSIFDAADSEQGKSTISYIKDVLDVSWSFIKTYALLAWDKISSLR